MKIISELAGIKVGDGCPVRVMGAVNVSPESFYKGSVYTRGQQLAETVGAMTEAGADFIDIGAMSSAPYLKTEISESEEASRLAWAVEIANKNTTCPVSIDTSRARPAEAGLAAGAEIINDICGLRKDPGLARLAKDAQGVILMANPAPIEKRWRDPVKDVKHLLRLSMKKAAAAGISRKKTVLDPGIGFFRETALPWWRWDIHVIDNLAEFRSLGLPLMVGLSRKSFIGHLLGGRPPDGRLPGSLAAAAIAVYNGAALIRTHDVAETIDAIRIAESILSERTSRRHARS